MTGEEPTDKLQDIEQLTAYLDGELDEAEVQHVEQRLEEDPDYLSEMQALQRSWDLLDQLPATEPDRSFTQTTMELVVGEARREMPFKFSWVWPIRLAVAALLFVSLFAIGYSMVRYAQTQPDRVLVQQLPVIDHHERFLAVDMDLDFVRQMVDRKLFPRDSLSSLEEPTLSESETERLLGGVFSKQATPEQRRDWVNSLDLDEKDKLKRKLNNFLGLPEELQNQLIEFERQVAEQSNRDELMHVINEYHTWLRMLDDGKRSRLMDLPVDQRLLSIAQEREQEARVQFGNSTNEILTRQDAEYVFDWFLGTIAAKETQIREYFPGAVQRNREELQLDPVSSRLLSALSKKAQLNHLVDYLIEIDQEYVEALLMDDTNLELLYLMLDSTARRTLNEQTEQGRKDLVISWVKDVNRAYYNISQDRLREFAESLPVEERDRLDRLSSRNYQARLRQLYLQRHGPGSDPVFDWRKILNSQLPRRRD